MSKTGKEKTRPMKDSVGELDTNSAVTTPVPADVIKAIDEDSEEVGGPWAQTPGDENAVGRTMFDLPTSKDGTVTVLMPPEKLDVLPGQALVQIESRPDSRTYLGAVVEGPFAEPDGLRADSTPMVVTSIKGGMLIPRYHGRAQIELIGERLESGAIVPPRRRPKPNSPAFALGTAETKAVLRLNGNLSLGLAEGFDDLEVQVPGDSKAVFPRHMGILGTTGAGKSTTVSGLVKKAQALGMAQVIIDVEGEYCAIHEPTDDPVMQEALERRGLEPEGVANSHVYHLVGRGTKNPAHPSVTPFSLRFCELSPYAVQEILELNDAQSTRFMQAYDITKAALEAFKIWPTNNAEKSKLLELDELDSGYPELTLAHLYDVVAQIAAIQQKVDDPYLETPQFFKNRERLKELIQRANVEGVWTSWRKVQGKLGQVKRLNIFDSANARPLNYSTMLQSGRVSIIDLSDTDAPQIRNLVIADLLRGIQRQQEQNYESAVKEQAPLVPATVLIEEAHEFLSANRIKQMEVLFQQVARIARRGRKRWLGLVFITQMPQHLPDEVLGLINNWVLHKVSDSNVVTRLKKSIGGINDNLWRYVPSLAAGQAIVSFTSMARPLQVTIDPTPCRLLMAE